MAKTILEYDTVSLDEENGALVIIDQTQLPGKIELLSLTDIEDIWEAIYLLKVRGAPAIGVTAAIGVYLAVKDLKTNDMMEFRAAFQRAKEYLATSRPTAVNLFWALERMASVVEESAASLDCRVEDVKELLLKEAQRIREEDIDVCRRIGENALTLVKPGDGLLTHCNAGKLAAVKYGTATAPMYLGQEKGYGFRLFVDETRPLLQGARLTAFELQEAGMDVTLICDNMSGAVMKKGWVDAIFVGCDRVAANGDAANKIGTSVVAAVAKYYGIPLYVCAPTSTIDMSLPAGDAIPIEERSAEEVTEMWYENRMAPEGVKVFNPCFDVTDHELIAGIVTEYGIAWPPYEESLKKIFGNINN
ncbi:MAG: S-methyl-5-thioribose-1-phosphate isomerase [Muricomes sp.]|uniref:S-methyl-5-thioribose-1-phosphate isomerase n=1 Tax=Faecalicatena contorta TaxID=39482 RepID=UPI002EA8C871|nr:S-methyl-5-thioribose-1-phosphate isomerase [Muricomes sp.]